MSYMFYYVPLIFPATYLLERFGIRRTLILGSCLSCLGAWIKTLATAPDRFYVALIGQSIVASTQVIRGIFIKYADKIIYRYSPSTRLEL